MEFDINSMILQARTQMLQRLVNMVPKDSRPEAIRLVEQLAHAEQLIALGSPPEDDSRYARIMYTIDAIKLYLTEADRAVTRKEIVEQVVRRGFRRPRTGSPEQTAGNVKKSLKMYLDGQARQKGELREVGDLVGLPFWSDDKFTALR